MHIISSFGLYRTSRSSPSELLLPRLTRGAFNILLLDVRAIIVTSTWPVVRYCQRRARFVAFSRVSSSDFHPRPLQAPRKTVLTRTMSPARCGKYGAGNEHYTIYRVSHRNLHTAILCLSSKEMIK